MSDIVSTASTVIGLPVHTFGLVRKRFEHVLAPSHLHPDLLRLAETALVHGFLLAFIGQAVAMPAREQFAGSVQLGDATAAIPAIGVDRASKPRAKSAEVAGRPRDWHALIDGHPLAVSWAPRPEHQDNCISFGPHADATGPLTAPGP